MKIYIASSMKNHILNSQIDSFLRNAGIEVFLPQRDSYEFDSTQFRGNRKAFAKAIYNSNVRGIDDADLIVIVGQNIGTDTSWECGYAIGKSKKVILLLQNGDKIAEMYMLFGSLSSCTHELSLSDSENFEESMKLLTNMIL